MKHINVEIDDKAIIERVERQVGNYKVPTNVPTEYFDGKIDKFLADNKQEIINAAAELLACKLCKGEKGE